MIIIIWIFFLFFFGGGSPGIARVRPAGNAGRAHARVPGVAGHAQRRPAWPVGSARPRALRLLTIWPGMFPFSVWLRGGSPPRTSPARPLANTVVLPDNEKDGQRRATPREKTRGGRISAARLLLPEPKTKSLHSEAVSLRSQTTCSPNRISERLRHLYDAHSFDVRRNYIAFRQRPQAKEFERATPGRFFVILERKSEWLAKIFLSLLLSEGQGRG